MEAAGGVARAGDGGRRAADDADRGQVLRHRRLAAERLLRPMPWALMTSASMFMRALAQNAAQPPAWVLEAREGREQQLRARLYEFLNTFASMQVAAVVMLLCLYLLGAGPAERALGIARLLFLAIIASMLAVLSVGISDSWGETAATFLGMVVIVTVMVLYILGELKGFVIKIGKVCCA